MKQKFDTGNKYVLIFLTFFYVLGRIIDSVMSWYFVDGVNYVELNPLYPKIGFVGIFILSLILYGFVVSIMKMIYLDWLKRPDYFLAIIGMLIGFTYAPIFSNLVQLGLIYGS